MKYKYMTVIQKNGPYESLFIGFADELNLHTVSTFLNSDIGYSSGKDAIDLLIDVLENKSQGEICRFNVCSIHIGKEYTRVVNDYTDEDGIDESIIETKELKNLIEAWYMETTKYCDNRKK